MEAHTPKRQAVEKFIQHEHDRLKGWQIQVIDERDEPLVRLQAVRQGESTPSGKHLDIHTRQVNLVHDEIDDTTKAMIRKWIGSLSA
jgi:hypothetical protein